MYFTVYCSNLLGVSVYETVLQYILVYYKAIQFMKVYWCVFLYITNILNVLDCITVYYTG